MMPRCACTLLAAWLLIPSVHAQVQPPARTDALGDPLPAGAVARLGTLRFKHAPVTMFVEADLLVPGMVTTARFSLDGRKIASLAAPLGTVRLWEAATGKELPGPWSARGLFCNAISWSPDSDVLAAAGREVTNQVNRSVVML
jgi:hypothetical protein